MILQEAGIPALKSGKSVSKAKMQAELATNAQNKKPVPNTNPSKKEMLNWVKEAGEDWALPLIQKNQWGDVKRQYVVQQLKAFGSPAQKEYVAWQADRDQRRMLGTDESDKIIPVYRPDPKNRFGGKNGLETQPTYLDPTMIQNQISAMRAGEKYGVPQLTPQQLKTFYSLEGRSDMGFNDVDFNDPKALSIAEKLKAEGFHPDQAYYAAALYNKSNQANRLGAPLPQAWNGFGTSEYGKTGMDYNNAYNAFGKVVDHPKNQEFNSLIDTTHANPIIPNAPKQQNQNQMPQVDMLGNATGLPAQDTGSSLFKKGGSVKPKQFRDMSKLLIQKHLEK